MKRLSVLLLVAAALACGGSDPGSIPLSKEPVSVRGWIADVEGGAPKGGVKTIETETVRLAQLFQGTNVWVEKARYVSGGVARDGSFMLLDVPPGNVTVEFSAPAAGIRAASVVMWGIPGNADVLIPGILLKRDGGVTLLQPKDVRIRVAAQVDKETPSGKMATIAGVRFPVMNTPLGLMVDRHDYPTPNGVRPVATFK